MSEETDVSKTLDTLTAKVGELSRVLNEKKELTETKIRENPLASIAGAFAGGILLGFLMSRKN